MLPQLQPNKCQVTRLFFPFKLLNLYIIRKALVSAKRLLFFMRFNGKDVAIQHQIIPVIA